MTGAIIVVANFGCGRKLLKELLDTYRHKSRPLEMALRSQGINFLIFISFMIKKCSLRIVIVIGAFAVIHFLLQRFLSNRPDKETVKEHELLEKRKVF